MTTTRIIILAQGEQRRLPDLKHPKQLLRLPSCGDVAILVRTLFQIFKILQEDASCVWLRPTVVAGKEIDHHLYNTMGRIQRPDIITLQDPGNSSLKGIARYLDVAGCMTGYRWDTTVVLLGDVVYSWACLRELLKPMRSMTAEYMFAGTADLTSSGGELWGVVWNEVADDMMRTRLSHALAKHPPFTSYQPGQMRRWLWEFCPPAPASRLLGHDLGALALSGRYVTIDDYTRDIDVVGDLLQIPWLSEMAAADDRANGVTW